MNPDRDADPTLTEIGFKQAAALGKYVAENFSEAAAAEGKIKPHHAIKKLFVSPMRRCMLTATPMSKGLGLPIRVRGTSTNTEGVSTAPRMSPEASWADRG